MSILTYDLETTTGSYCKRKASQFLDTNYIVAAGWKHNAEPTYGEYYELKSEITIPDLTKVKMLVGFNIKFDLLWLWHRQELQDFFARGGQVWDCQYAEYLLQGMVQESQMCSMDSIIESYGGTLKIDAVKALWEDGVDTPDIPKDLLMDYLLGNEEDEIEGDVNNTYKIFLGQVAKASQIHPHFIQMVKNRMDGLLATTEMEYNGLFVNQEIAEKNRADLAARCADLEEQLFKFIPELPEELEFNWGSIYHRSYLLYGGTAKYLKWVQHTNDETDELLWCKKDERQPKFKDVPCSLVHPTLELCEDTGLYRRKDTSGEFEYQDVFKSGKSQGEGKFKTVTIDDLTKPKGAKQDHFFEFTGYIKPDKRWKLNLFDGRGVPLSGSSGDILETIGKRFKEVEFADVLTKRTAANKDLSTYYWVEDKKTGKRKGMLTVVGSDSIIHHKLNHTSTVTSRLSSSDPNLQNLPRKDKSIVKGMFTSRFGEDGYICEQDYSALEVYVQAIMTKDKQLNEDLRSGIDFHCKRLALAEGLPYDEVFRLCKIEALPIWDEKRTKIKGFSFQLAYGAGAFTIAEYINMPIDDVKKLITIEEATYPSVVDFNAEIKAIVEATREPTGRQLFVDGKVFSQGMGEWFSPTGTRYCWTENEAPEFLWQHGKYVGFKPTEIKNYWCQGTGGEVMQTMSGLLWRWVVSQPDLRGKAYLVNTVHDSIYWDLHKSVVHKVIPKSKQILEMVRQKFNLDFDMGITVDFKIDSELGRSMLKMNGYNPETIY